MAWKRSRNSRNNKRRYFRNFNKKEGRNLKVLLKYKGPIKAPIEKDSQIASIEIYVKDELIKKQKFMLQKS